MTSPIRSCDQESSGRDLWQTGRRERTAHRQLDFLQLDFLQSCEQSQHRTTADELLRSNVPPAALRSKTRAMFRGSQLVPDQRSEESRTFQSASSEFACRRNRVLSSSYQGQSRPQNEVAEVPRSLSKSKPKSDSELDQSRFDHSRLPQTPHLLLKSVLLCTRLQPRQSSQ